MQYLYDNGFEVLTMSDLHFDEITNTFSVPILEIERIKSIGNTTSNTSPAHTNEVDDPQINGIEEQKALISLDFISHKL